MASAVTFRTKIVGIYTEPTDSEDSKSISQSGLKGKWAAIHWLWTLKTTGKIHTCRTISALWFTPVVAQPWWEHFLLKQGETNKEHVHTQEAPSSAFTQTIHQLSTELLRKKTFSATQVKCIIGWYSCKNTVWFIKPHSRNNTCIR